MRHLFASVCVVAVLAAASVASSQTPNPHRLAHSPAPPAPSATALFKSAFDALSGGDSETAVRLFRQGLGTDPNNALAWFYLGEALTRQGRTDEAAAAYRRSLSVGPTSTVADKARQRLAPAPDAPQQARQAPIPATPKAPEAIMLPSGISLADWEKWAVEELKAGRQDAVLEQGSGYQQQYPGIGHVKAILDRAVEDKLTTINVTDAASARTNLPILLALKKSFDSPRLLDLLDHSKVLISIELARNALISNHSSDAVNILTTSLSDISANSPDRQAIVKLLLRARRNSKITQAEVQGLSGLYIYETNSKTSFDRISANGDFAVGYTATVHRGPFYYKGGSIVDVRQIKDHFINQFFAIASGKSVAYGAAEGWNNVDDLLVVEGEQTNLIEIASLADLGQGGSGNYSGCTSNDGSTLFISSSYGNRPKRASGIYVFKNSKFIKLTPPLDIGNYYIDKCNASNDGTLANFLLKGMTPNDFWYVHWSQKGGFEKPFNLKGFTPTSVSDGGVVVGYFLDASRQSHAATWTTSGGISDLGTFGRDGAYLLKISSDGNIKIGLRTTKGGASEYFKIYDGGEIEALDDPTKDPKLPPGFNIYLKSFSDDGSIAAGSITRSTGDDYIEKPIIFAFSPR